MDRSTRRRLSSLIGVASLGLTLALASSTHAQIGEIATPQPSGCGTPVSSWGAGTVDDVSVDLLRFEASTQPASATPQASPTAGSETIYVADLEITNASDVLVRVVADNINLQLCNGTFLSPESDLATPLVQHGDIKPGETVSGDITFAVVNGATPMRLIIPISRPGMSDGRVEFPLVTENHNDGSGADGATGADAVGGDAIGGDGEDGADATAESGQ